MGALVKMTVTTAIGFMLAILAIVWIEPAGAGGMVFLFIICMAFTIIVSAAIKAFRGR